MENTLQPISRKHKVDVRLAVLGITANDISRLWGCTPQQFLYWARSDHRDVREPTIERLADILGVEQRYLQDTQWDGVFSPIPVWLLVALEEDLLEQKAQKQAEKKQKIIEALDEKQKETKAEQGN